MSKLNAEKLEEKVLEFECLVLVGKYYDALLCYGRMPEKAKRLARKSNLYKLLPEEAKRLLKKGNLYSIITKNKAELSL